MADPSSGGEVRVDVERVVARPSLPRYKRGAIERLYGPGCPGGKPGKRDLTHAAVAQGAHWRTGSQESQLVDGVVLLCDASSARGATPPPGVAPGSHGGAWGRTYRCSHPLSDGELNRPWRSRVPRAAWGRGPRFPNYGPPARG
ncbi:hypothetical protein GCM10009801_55970 [Streptomyces albiaxialis]|uniref:Transposase IS701-like DDE domain-containing protein n=1 Tax=Streptomyces albiaxialis TaxID=329523 RepID=A0ABN2WFR1_9ACTN